ncbi:hypothetical protein GJV26_03975 [Massilia dura]|uniref:Uncharacterized protein n=1 Tax=Pseudoduganella dura TaxID=321982 RepID=A0A6I3XIW6_9BURK|nr:hypothetical protein [Pseudoduganella dura]MUI11645.1 hypothetical protein [Pseudoduganella dura]GGX78003.1 hypothetical protein GCM10007386_06210 [Pseudoduganella dura]
MNARIKKQFLLKPQHARTNRKMRDLVDQAVAALPEVGIRNAAEFLASLHVPVDVAVRALVYPKRRRAVTPPSYARTGRNW